MTDTTSAVPNPGSDEAAMRGCTCARIDNHHGKGWRGIPGVFVYTSGCIVHWPAGTTFGPFVASEEKGR
ncbi:MAG: hypothetical protein EOS79_11490 [Mesorhizobium sp.]|nr:MAG: hypothetical protein EOS79_11490 [Mesorhizobium sp.]